VVVELFTSRGCSSCPAADRNLTSILAKAQNDGDKVLGLSFHVDYWNHIGWKDPYSSRAFTERQRQYQRGMGLSSLYTPQRVINGGVAFVGSDKNRSEKEISSALKQAPRFVITIGRLAVEGGDLQVDYTLDKPPGDEVIHLAVVEKDASNFVLRGENNGKTLHHNNVVRAFTTYSASQAGRLKMKLPGLKGETSVILYIQQDNLRMVGSTGSHVPEN
jgi:hypothetical protein